MELFWRNFPEPRRRREGCRINLMETLTLFMVIFSFLGLIVDVIRLTVEVVDKFYQKKHDDNKKD